MTEAEKRKIHELMGKASDGAATAELSLEQRVLAFEAARATDDAVYVLDRLSLIGLADLRERILTVLQRNRDTRTDDRPPWVA